MRSEARDSKFGFQFCVDGRYTPLAGAWNVCGLGRETLTDKEMKALLADPELGAATQQAVDQGTPQPQQPTARERDGTQEETCAVRRT